MLSLVMAAWLAGAAPGPPACVAAEKTGSPALRLGPEQAPTTVVAWVDPTSVTALYSVLELRRLVGDLGGEITVQVRLVAGTGTTDPRTDDVRRWVAAVAEHGELVPALRLLHREGPERIRARLQSPSSRAALARELGLEPELHERLLSDPCVQQTLDAQQRQLTRALTERGMAVFRLPVFRVEDQLFEDSSGLDKLRPILGRMRVEARRDAARPPAAPPEPQVTSERLENPELRGAVLGGIGLPHRFVLMAREEDDTNLLMLLPPLIEFRRDHPGRLAVQVVARGNSTAANLLRHRLCAARKTGRVLEYVSYLATEPSLRSTHASTKALLKTLDAVPVDRCTDEPDPAQLGLPDGGWLDGIPRTRSELQNLEATLELLEASRRPLSALVAPRPQETDDQTP